MAKEMGQIEQDGYEGTVYLNEERGSEFVAWELAVFSADHGSPVRITGVTGRKGSPRAAAWNLQNSLRVGFLQRVLRSRVQLGREGGSILVTVPGAQIQGTGYDKPLALTLQERIAGVGDLNLALSMMAETIKNVAARGVYARLNQQESEDEPEEGEELDSIEF